MFAKSKIISPLVAILVACVAVGAVPAIDVPIAQHCNCQAYYVLFTLQYPNGTIVNSGIPLPGANIVSTDQQTVIYTQQLCSSLNPANAAYSNDYCYMTTESAHAGFISACEAEYVVDHLGNRYNGVHDCYYDIPASTLPTSCFCESAAGSNATETQTLCNVDPSLTNSTLVNNKCEITTQTGYFLFTSGCANYAKSGVPSVAVCSTV